MILTSTPTPTSIPTPIFFTTTTLDSRFHSKLAEKRYWAHNGSDPGANDPIELNWYKLSQPAGQTPYYTPYVIHIGAGTGTQFVVDDLNNDGKPDVIIANKTGVHTFVQD